MDLRKLSNADYRKLMIENPTLMARELIRLRVSDLLDEIKETGSMVDFITMGVKILNRKTSADVSGDLEGSEANLDAEAAKEKMVYAKLAEEIQKQYDAMIAEDFLADLPITPLDTNETDQ